MKLKRFDWIKKFIKLCIAYPNFWKILNNLNNSNNIERRRGIYIGSPVHSNLGDHLITSESLKFINTLKFDEVIEVPEFLFELFDNKIKVNDSDVIFIAGGGWMGNLYEDEIVVEEIIKKWINNRIIILPQTIFFGDGKYSSQKQLKEVLDCHNDILLTVREENSYKFCLNELAQSKERCRLLPDMALLRLNEIRKVENKKNYSCVIIALRNDREKNFTKNISKIIREIEREKIKIRYSSSIAKEKIIPKYCREKIINRKIKEFSKADIVITDRLHTMIFSLIAGTKCIAIDNSTHKVTGVYNKWLKNMKGLAVLNKIDDLSSNLIKRQLTLNERPESIEYRKYFKEI